jgi:hypothetical protein
MKSIALGLLAVLVMSPGLGWGSDFYVATDGNDANPGTVGKPFRTLNQGVKLLKPGDSLVVRAGIYRESLIYSIPPGTSWDAPVTIKAHAGEKVILRPDGGAARVLEFWECDARPQQYIVIDGLVLDAVNVLHDCVKMYQPAHHLRFVRCEIKNAANQGVLGPADGCEFLDLLVHDNGIRTGTHGLYLGGKGARIEGCRIYNNFGNGLRNNGLFSSVIAYNIIHHNALGQFSPAVEFNGHGSMLHHNVLYANRGSGGIIVRDQAPEPGKIYHNTLVGNAGPGIVVATAQGDLLHLANNIIALHKKDTGLYNILADSKSTFENNILFGNKRNLVDEKPSGVWRENREVDPQFADADSRDYRLAAKSPARDAGVALPGLSKDMDGGERVAGAGPDIGAYEFNPQVKALQGNRPPEVEAGPDLVTTMAEPTVFLSGAVTSDGRPVGRVTAQWKKMYGPGAVTFASASSARTKATFSGPGGYLLKLFADNGELCAGDIAFLYVHPQFKSESPIRVEAEHMFLDTYEVKKAPFASGGKYVQTTMGWDLWTMLPIPKGTYDVAAGYFDSSAGQAAAELTVTRGERTDPESFKVLVGKEWKYDQDVAAKEPSEKTAVRRLVAENLQLQTGDLLTVSVVTDQGETGTFDYFEFVPKD